MNKSFFYSCLCMALLAFLPVAAVFSQPLQITVERAVLDQEGLKALMVSNQYGVLRYFAFQHKLEKGSAHTFSVLRRRGEQLALTLVSEEDKDGLFSFSNTTYTHLGDSARIRLPKIQSPSRSAFRTVDLTVEKMQGAKDVKLLGPLGKRTAYSMSGSDLKVRGLLKEGSGVFALVQLPDEKKYRYFMSRMDRTNRFTVPVQQLGDSVAYRRIEMPYADRWEGQITGMLDGVPYYLFFQPRPLSEKSAYLQYAWPVDTRFDSTLLRLTALKEEGNAYFGTYRELPEKLPSFRFVEDFSSLESKGFTFAAAEEEGDYYAVSYYYSLGEGMPIPNWHIWGPTKGRDTVDFILPDLPAELYEMMPELNEVVAPIAVDKTSFRCTMNCENYDYAKAPAALQDFDWRLRHNLISRRKLRDIDE